MSATVVAADADEFACGRCGDHWVSTALGDGCELFDGRRNNRGQNPLAAVAGLALIIKRKNMCIQDVINKVLMTE
ncbi:hypothetical protein COEREDRAFT_81470 [Coemansia reversa NRRL 1564]|uniref:Uncharacterized protein n=1 Tax=Coemansia reversa (strain ATCC 12441 / NRRL 1564) TaxID=763665 RepID=A0A2G5BBD0_COERN|nr:hypothetical protein COEREDRAFT_81470 [Coemansia reversa NRRL 1564]|eukprot:PIA16017.1 hypothetical protein COEREDRAFT_81470 [Coemansia reversa NRRL 1564]